MNNNPPPSVRFWRRVQKSDGCWLWSGKKNSDGYGEMQIDGRFVKAHRYSWMLASGPVPDGMCVCHRCDTPRCVNPSHLFLGTHTDNMRDMARKGRGVSSGRRGEELPWTKLNEAAVLAIREDQRPQRLIAKDYGIAQPLVSMIKTRSVWKHI
jgi:hypothetical protein